MEDDLDGARDRSRARRNARAASPKASKGKSQEGKSARRNDERRPGDRQRHSSSEVLWRGKRGGRALRGGERAIRESDRSTHSTVAARGARH